MRRRQPRQKAGEDAADHRHLRGADVEEPADQAGDVPGGFLDDRHRERIPPFGVIEDQRGELAEILRRGAVGPGDRDRRVMIEPVEHGDGKRRHRRHALVRPERTADRGAADHHAAALVADLMAPAADIDALATDHGEPGGAGADDEDGAVAPVEGAHVGGIGVGIDDHRGERVLLRQDEVAVRFLRRAGKAEAGVDACEVLCGNVRRLCRRRAGLHHLGEGGWHLSSHWPGRRSPRRAGGRTNL